MSDGSIYGLTALIFLVIILLWVGISILKNLISSELDYNPSKDKYMLIKGMGFIITGIFVSIYIITYISSNSIDFFLVILVLIAIFALFLCQKIF